MPGDISLCARCGEILQFDHDLKLVIPTLKDMMTWQPDLSAQAQFFQAAIRKQRPIPWNK
jgi:hypothetical protein